MKHDAPCSCCDGEMEWQYAIWEGHKTIGCSICGNKPYHIHTNKKEWKEFLHKQKEKLT